MFSTGNKAKKTIFGAMTCSKCGKTLNNDENITIKINTKELKGYTHLSSWADAQYKLCENCSD
ncbi:hypothetical protein D7S79_34795 [Ralstonia insidiosa]|nr:hypothetical protein [Ralstonia insidiosa]